MKKVDVKICKECQEKQNIELFIHKGNLAFSGFCGKSLVFVNHMRTVHDNNDCPSCPILEDPVEYVERVIKSK